MRLIIKIQRVLIDEIIFSALSKINPWGSEEGYLFLNAFLSCSRIARLREIVLIVGRFISYLFPPEIEVVLPELFYSLVQFFLTLLRNPLIQKFPLIFAFVAVLTIPQIEMMFSQVSHCVSIELRHNLIPMIDKCRLCQRL